MANYSELHQTINDNIKPNGNQQITGQVLQNVLNAIVDSLAEGYLFAGVATADGNPGSLDQNAWWLAGPGTYENYGNITVAEGKLAALMWNGEWSSSTVDVGGVIKAGTGIKLDESGAIAIDLVAGDFISIEGNKISCTLDANPFYFTDALPETPVPGTENKVYVVPNSEGTGYDLYQWDAETSAFNKVGSISFTFDPSDFVKKNEVNEATGPTTLSADAAYQLGLRNTTSRSAGVDFDNGAGEGKNMLQVRSKAGNPATDSYMQWLLNGGNNVLTFDSNGLHVGDSSQSQRVLPTIILNRDNEHNFFSFDLITFTYSGIYALLESAFQKNFKICINDTLTEQVVDVVTYYKISNNKYELFYTIGLSQIFAIVENDDTVSVNRRYNLVRRIIASDYGISSWYNASGTSVDLYNDLRRLIANANNVDGVLGILCDTNNTFVIIGVNLTISGSITTLTVGLSEPNGFSHDTLTVDSTGAFSVRRWPKLQVAWADNYNLIASGMPRPDAWLVADGTDVSFYNVVNEAHKHGYQLILKEYSYGYSGTLNQYTVKSIVPGGTGYSLFFESGGRQYVLTINADGSMSTVSNVFNASDYGLSSWAASASGTNITLAQKLSVCFNYNLPIIFKTATNAYPATTAFKSDAMMRFFYDDGSLGSTRGTASLTVNGDTGEYSIAVI